MTQLNPLTNTNKGPQWFALTVLPGQEQRAGDALRKRVTEVQEVVVPKETLKKNNRLGQKITFDKLIFPGYTFVKIEMTTVDGVLNTDVYEKVRSIPGVRDFVGTITSSQDGQILNITPMTEKEMDDIKEYVQVNKEAGGRVAKAFAVNDRIRITGGSFMGLEGFVNSIDNEKGKANVLLQVFGRETATEVSTSDIELATE